MLWWGRDAARDRFIPRSRELGGKSSGFSSPCDQCQSRDAFLGGYGTNGFDDATDSKNSTVNCSPAKDSIMTESPWYRIPIAFQVILGFCVLCVLILVPVLLPVSLPGPVPVPGANATVHVKILAINDFHGQLPLDQKLNKRPAADPGSLCLPQSRNGTGKCRWHDHSAAR